MIIFDQPMFIVIILTTNERNNYFLITDFIDHVKTGAEAQADTDVITTTDSIY